MPRLREHDPDTRQGALGRHRAVNFKLALAVLLLSIVRFKRALDGV